MADLIAQKNTRERAAVARSLFACVCALSIILSGCGRDKEVDSRPAQSNLQPASAVADAERILTQYRATDNSDASSTRMRANIQSSGKEFGSKTPPVVELTMHRKRATDGTKLLLIEFTSPDEERDRNALVVVGPAGDVEGTRYAQSSDSFITSKDVMTEESLFGLTLQELADGQTEKYDFKLTGEENFQSSPVYRLDGSLKQGAESKFPRLVLLISKENFMLRAAEFYDNKNNLARAITVTEMKQIDGHWTRTRWTVDNRLRQKKIDFETTGAKYGGNISDSIFTREHLKLKAKR
jgi:Outer membrane lipoprotein-sorting protein